MNKKGKFIVLEGADGSGKTTQQRLLAERIEKELKREVFELDFPQYEISFFGKMVGQFLHGDFGSIDSVDPHLVSLPYALDRWKAKPQIIEALGKGKIIVANRYVLSNMAHQTAKVPKKKQDAFLRFLYRLEYKELGIPQEDLNIFLYVPWKISQKLVEQKKKRKYLRGNKKDIHEQDTKHQKLTANMYKLLASKNKHIVRINCYDSNQNLLSIGEIHELVWKVARSMIEYS